MTAVGTKRTLTFHPSPQAKTSSERRYERLWTFNLNASSTRSPDCKPVHDSDVQLYKALNIDESRRIAMPLLTVTEAAKSIGVSRTTLYDKIKSGELSRNAEKQIDTADLLRVFGEFGSPATEQPVDAQVNTSDVMAAELLDMVQSRDVQLTQIRTELDETKTRLNEHREAARALMSPEDFEKKESAWKTALAERQQEIEQARSEANEIREREQQARAELAAMQKRGFIDRLLNKKPELA